MTQPYCNISRIQNASWVFAIRRVSHDAAKVILPAESAPHPGDLIRATVTFLGQHPGLQLPNGRRKQLSQVTRSSLRMGHSL